MKYRAPAPLLLAAASVAIGISVHNWTGGPADVRFSFFITLACLLASCVLAPATPRRTGAIVLLFVSVGTNNAAFHDKPGQTHVSRRVKMASPSGASVVLAGTIASAPSQRGDRARFVLDAVCMQMGSECLPVRGRLHVWFDHERRVFAQGDGIALKARMRGPTPLRNPADFDVVAWFDRIGISGTLTNVHLIQHCRRTDIPARVIHSVRSGIRRAIGDAVPVGSHDLPIALLLGDRSLLSDETKSDFARSGLMHLLAISGLHVMLVGMVLYRLLRPLLMRLNAGWWTVELTRSCITLAVLVLYALVSGSSPSVVRAVLMAGFLLSGTLVRGVSSSLNALGAAALAILMFDPSSLDSAGFQLSFSAVGGLLMLGRGVDSDLISYVRSRFSRYLLSGMCTSFVATLATAPILMYHFGYVGFAGILFNLGAIPIGAALLCSSILVTIAGYVSVGLAAPLGSCVELLAMSLKWLARLGGTPEILVLATLSVAAFSISCLLLLAAFVTPRRGRFRRHIVILSLVPPVASILWSLVTSAYEPRVDVLFLDVGHGDAAIVRLPNGRSLVIDAGNRSLFRDEGRRTVIPHLEELDIPEVDFAVVSHPHADHLGGIPSLIRAHKALCIADNGQPAASELHRETQDLVRVQQVCHLTLSAGDTLTLGPFVRVIVLAPPREETADEANDRSIVLKLIYGETSFLFTGDIESEAEKFLVKRYCTTLDSNVIKVPHHGSRTSSTEAFVECTTAGKSGRAVISVGSPVKYGLPNQDVVTRWQIAGYQVHSTYLNGALWLQSDGSTVRQRRWR